MTFRRLAEYFAELEKTRLRNKIMEILALLFKEAEATEMKQLAYLLQGRVAPHFSPVEFGIADRMMIRAIARGINLQTDKVNRLFKGEGDLGKTVEKLKSENIKHITYNKKLKITEVYDILYKVATAGGAGSQEVKIKLLADLLKTVDPLAARYIVRMTLGKLRMGFSDMTVLDSLSYMLAGSKELRPKIERAYNVRPDLGFISSAIKEKGIGGISHVKPVVGTPILMARAERLTSPGEIIKKIGKCSVEAKIDGFRLQVHYKRGKEEKIWLYSRNLENVTFMYPDITQGVKTQIKVKEAIFEGEAVAFHLQTKQYLPFQEIVQRRRKYDIEQKALEIPLKLICFDLLYFNGENFLHKTYLERRNQLKKIIKSGETLLLAEEKIVANEGELQLFFDDCVSRGLEGIIAKKIEGTYQAGARGWNWIKYKRSYEGKLSDTIDAVIMGFDFGQGRRTSFGIGDFLIGIYDDKTDAFKTVAKIGTGLTDNEWKELKIQSSKLKIKNKPKNYDVDKMMECDVWVTPQIVVEIRADEITKSPVHTAGRVMSPSKSGNAFEVKVPGYALRFPRLEKFREDKSPADATTLAEVEKMYKLQGRNQN